GFARVRRLRLEGGRAAGRGQGNRLASVVGDYLWRRCLDIGQRRRFPLMSTDVERWFRLFAPFGRPPSPDSYAAVFHPDGEVADAGMATPTPASQVREAIAHVPRLMPDLRIDMRRYLARGDTVFVEAANTGTINGIKVAWGAVYRVHL